jgi:hypothetical protein
MGALAFMEEVTKYRLNQVFCRPIPLNEREDVLDKSIQEITGVDMFLNDFQQSDIAMRTQCFIGNDA